VILRAKNERELLDIALDRGAEASIDGRALNVDRKTVPRGAKLDRATPTPPKPEVKLPVLPKPVAAPVIDTKGIEAAVAMRDRDLANQLSKILAALSSAPIEWRAHVLRDKNRLIEDIILTPVRPH
jgi:hypothetical protein